MRLWQKILALSILTPFLVVIGYVTYLWATYIDETVTSGTAYGFVIGSSKQEALTAVGRLDSYPSAVVYVIFGPKAGDHFTVRPLSSHIEQLADHDEWDVLLDGDGKFFNSVRLTFRSDALAEIHRHRQYFELP